MFALSRSDRHLVAERLSDVSRLGLAQPAPNAGVTPSRLDGDSAVLAQRKTGQLLGEPGAEYERRPNAPAEDRRPQFDAVLAT
jgi:hypothetical protein